MNQLPSKESLESEVGETLTDTEFRSICTEIEGRLNNLYDEVIQEIIEKIKEGYSYSLRDYRSEDNV